MSDAPTSQDPSVLSVQVSETGTVSLPLAELPLAPGSVVLGFCLPLFAEEVTSS